MAIINTHQVTLYGGCGSDIVLHPLNDSHLPYLYAWSADPEVLYWTEGGTADTNLTYGPESVNGIYGMVSEHALCFLVEMGGVVIGECWLQQMNIPEVIAMYPKELDVRRIDMSIGEKAYWGKGIGTEFVGMLIDFAFHGEHVDVLHCFCEDYNIRSQRVWERHGFTRVWEEPLTPQLQKGKWQYHYRLTRQDFIAKRRENIPADQRLSLPIADLTPSQLHISEGKLRLVKEWFDPDNPGALDPIPVIRLNDRTVMADGHTRAVAALLAGWQSVPVYLDESDLSPELYQTCVTWCDEEGIKSPADLLPRILPHADYERLWLKRCMEGL